MWKTPDRFWAQISPFTHILPSETAEIHCTAMDLPLFRKPQLGTNFPAGLTRNLRFHQLGLMAIRWEPPGWGTFAYLVKRSCMQRLVEQYLPSAETLNLVGYHWPERVAADALLYHAAISYSTCFPLATTGRLSGATDIGYTSAVMTLTEQARQMAENLWIAEGILSS